MSINKKYVTLKLVAVAVATAALASCGGGGGGNGGSPDPDGHHCKEGTHLDKGKCVPDAQPTSPCDVTEVAKNLTIAPQITSAHIGRTTSNSLNLKLTSTDTCKNLSDITAVAAVPVAADSCRNDGTYEKGKSSPFIGSSNLAVGSSVLFLDDTGLSGGGLMENLKDAGGDVCVRLIDKSGDTAYKEVDGVGICVNNGNYDPNKLCKTATKGIDEGKYTFNLHFKGVSDKYGNNVCPITESQTVGITMGPTSQVNDITCRPSMKAGKTYKITPTFIWEYSTDMQAGLSQDAMCIIVHSSAQPINQYQSYSRNEVLHIPNCPGAKSKYDFY